MLSHISRGKTLTTSLASPIPCYQRRLALAPPTHRHQAGTLPVATKPPRGRSSMAEPQPSKLVMRVRFPSPAPTEYPQVSRLSSGRMVIIYGVGCSPAGHKRATARTSDALASLAGRPGSHLVHQPAEGLRDGLITVPGGMLVDHRGPRA
jgi:hypothetical protein